MACTSMVVHLLGVTEVTSVAKVFKGQHFPFMLRIVYFPSAGVASDAIGAGHHWRLLATLVWHCAVPLNGNQVDPHQELSKPHWRQLQGSPVRFSPQYLLDSKLMHLFCVMWWVLERGHARTICMAVLSDASLGGGGWRNGESWSESS